MHAPGWEMGTRVEWRRTPPAGCLEGNQFSRAVCQFFDWVLSITRYDTFFDASAAMVLKEWFCAIFNNFYIASRNAVQRRANSRASAKQNHNSICNWQFRDTITLWKECQTQITVLNVWREFLLHYCVLTSEGLDCLELKESLNSYLWKTERL